MVAAYRCADQEDHREGGQLHDLLGFLVEAAALDDDAAETLDTERNEDDDRKDPVPS